MASGHDIAGPNERLMSIGRLFGLLAAFCVLLELTLMSRAPFIERDFDLQDIIDLHRLTGYGVLLSISAHVVFLTISYAAGSLSLWAQFLDFNNHYEDILMATIGTGVFFLATSLSVRIIRTNIRYELWYVVHLTIYLAIVLTFLHQIPNGNDFIGSPWFTAFWYGLYGFVTLIWAWYRVLRPYWLAIKYDFRVYAVERAAANTYSVFLTGRNIQRFKFQPGQYANWRIMARGLWTESHPFSISSPIDNGLLRFTAKVSGSYTAKLRDLKPGARVLVDGPRGNFGADRAELTSKAVLIGGGIGVAPFLSTANMLLRQRKQVTLLYAAKTMSDVAFINELRALQPFGLTIRLYVSEYNIHITREVLAQYAVEDTTIYICGPDGMSKAFQKTLKELGFPKQRVIIERFAY